jgi:hypothetical protein
VEDIYYIGDMKTLLLISAMIGSVYASVPDSTVFPCPSNQVMDTVYNKRGKAVLFDITPVPFIVCENSLLVQGEYKIPDSSMVRANEIIMRTWHKGMEVDGADSLKLCYQARFSMNNGLESMSYYILPILYRLATIPSCIDGVWLKNRVSKMRPIYGNGK